MITYIDEAGNRYRVAGYIRRYNKTNGEWERCNDVTFEDLRHMNSTKS